MMPSTKSKQGPKQTPRILVVDDEAHIRELLEITLIKMGMDVDSAANLSTAKKYYAQNNYSLVLTDMRLSDGLGLELVDEVTKSKKNTPIAVITAFGSTDNAVVALKAGAFDYISKPVALDQLRKLVISAIESSAIESPSMQPSAPTNTSRLIGQSQVMQECRMQLTRLARSMAPIAIFGESGSGKELAAREIHAQSARANKPFIAVNCGAIPETLMEAEFFGYRKGAFTGANEDRDGFFQAANGGTLLLDEVADLPLAMQVKLLRAIQERAVRKIGATSEEAIDVRIISATHQNLEECVANKQFRQDLFYRLNVIELKLPSLRERRDDIAMLSETILQRLSDKPTTLSAPALHALRGYDFPGNVRELENILERALTFANEGVIEPADLALKVSKNNSADPSAPPCCDDPAQTTMLSPAISPNTAPFTDIPNSLPAYLENIEREIILRALQKTRYNKTQAAELLGVSFRQLRYSIQKLRIDETN